MGEVRARRRQCLTRQREPRMRTVIGRLAPAYPAYRRSVRPTGTVVRRPAPS